MGMDHPRLDLRLHWLDLLTLGFGFYAANFGNYGKTYGSLATVVVLVTWMYLSAYALIFGAELNSELEHQTARDTTAGAQKPMGERGAWSADHVARDGEPRQPRAEEIGSEPPHEFAGLSPPTEHLTSRRGQQRE